MLSGGSFASTSLICAARMFTVQVAPAGRTMFGVSVCVAVPLPLSVNAWLAGQVMVYAVPPAFTASLYVIWMAVFVGRLVAPLAGLVDCTDGAASTPNVKT